MDFHRYFWSEYNTVLYTTHIIIPRFKYSIFIYHSHVSSGLFGLSVRQARLEKSKQVHKVLNGKTEWPYKSQMFHKKKRLEKYLELSSVKRAFQDVT